MALPHTDPTDLTGFPLWVGNLTEASSPPSWEAHTDPTDLTGFSFVGGKSLCLTRISLIFCGICGLELIFWGEMWGNRQKVRNFTF